MAVLLGVAAFYFVDTLWLDGKYHDALVSELSKILSPLW
jgi:hypothetical protein